MFQLVKVDYVIVKINEKNLNTTAANFNDNGYFNQSSCFESDKCQIDHTKVCVGDSLYCNLTRDDYTELLNDYIAPTLTERILIFSHSVVFLMGLVSLFN